MPAIHREDGFEVVIWTRDHRPPHVHVFLADGEAIIALGEGDEAPSFREVHGMRTKDAIRAFRIVEANRDTFLSEWRRIHG